MILIDSSKHSENTIFYIAAKAYKLILNDKVTSISTLSDAIQLEISIDGSIDEIITLALDFLYLINKISINKDGSLYVIENP